MQKTHPVDLAQELLLWGGASAQIGSVVQRLGLITDIALRLYGLLLVLIGTHDTLEGRGHISDNSGHQGMTAHFFEGHSPTLIAYQTLPDEILQVLRQSLQQIDVPLVDFLDQLSFIRAGPGRLSM